MKKLLFLIFLFAGQSNIFAQYSRYIIQLKDKSGNPFSINNPIQYLSKRAIDRRFRYNIRIDESDLPVTPAYMDSIRLSGNVRILNVSKWLNQVAIQTTDTVALAKINSYSFVLVASPIALRIPSIAGHGKQPDPGYEAPGEKPLNPQNPTDFYNYGAAYPQVHLHSGEFLHNLGFRGDGMQLALMDAGFYHYKSLPTFDSIRNNNLVLGTWDFVTGDTNVDEDYVHGMSCLSIIGANLPGTFVGTAPQSSFYLFRTEDVSSEYPIEEQNWAAAAEKADSLGADVFSVSLGYNLFDNSIFNHAYSDMNGKTTIIARAAGFAAKKGILAVVAVGNEGNSSWKYLTTPADADSILAVGAVNAARQVAGFSSYGPSADGRIKPDVAALGVSTVIADQNTGQPAYGSGTSYACPVMAGLVTCLWQAFPEVNNMSIIDALRKSSDRAAMPDDRSGYGIPDVKKAFVYLIKKLYTQEIGINDTCKARIVFTIKAGDHMNMVVERKLPTDMNYAAVSTLNFTGAFASGNYTYTDDLSSLRGGIMIKYRLKMNIAADTSFYLDSATVNYGTPCNSITEKITISPNPVTDQLTVLIANNDVKATVYLYSMSGQKIYSDTRQVSGVQSFLIPMKRLSRGIYLVTVFLNDKKQIVKKIIRD